MNKVLFFFGGLVIGGAAGTGATYFILKKKEDEKINNEISKIKGYGAVSSDGDIGDEDTDSNSEEETIPDLAEMANRVKTEDSKKTDYTGFSKSEESKKSEKVKSAIEYVDMDTAYNLESDNNYVIDELDYYMDGVLVYNDEEETKTTPEKLGIDMSKAKDDELYAVNHAEQRIYEISISQMNYDDEEEDKEDDGEQSESEA